MSVAVLVLLVGAVVRRAVVADFRTARRAGMASTSADRRRASGRLMLLSHVALGVFGVALNWGYGGSGPARARPLPAARRYTAARPVLEALTRQAAELGITLHARPGDPALASLAAELGITLHARPGDPALASLYHELGFHSAGTRPRLRRDPHLPATTNGGT